MTVTPGGLYVPNLPAPDKLAGIFPPTQPQHIDVMVAVSSYR